MSSIDSKLMNTLVRMVVPMRREFGRSLDVSHFMRDTSYAREVLDRARQSMDPRLRDYAAWVEKAMRGTRAGSIEAARDEPAAATGVAAQDHPDADAQALRAGIARKYIAGLR
jgi:hypothetical protein